MYYPNNHLNPFSQHRNSCSNQPQFQNQQTHDQKVLYYTPLQEDLDEQTRQFKPKFQQRKAQSNRNCNQQQIQLDESTIKFAQRLTSINTTSNGVSNGISNKNFQTQMSNNIEKIYNQLNNTQIIFSQNVNSMRSEISQKTDQIKQSQKNLKFYIQSQLLQKQNQINAIRQEKYHLIQQSKIQIQTKSQQCMIEIKKHFQSNYISTNNNLEELKDRLAQTRFNLQQSHQNLKLQLNQQINQNKNRIANTQRLLAIQTQNSKQQSLRVRKQLLQKENDVRKMRDELQCQKRNTLSLKKMIENEAHKRQEQCKRIKNDALKKELQDQIWIRKIQQISGLFHHFKQQQIKELKEQHDLNIQMMKKEITNCLLQKILSQTNLKFNIHNSKIQDSVLARNSIKQTTAIQQNGQIKRRLELLQKCMIDKQEITEIRNWFSKTQEQNEKLNLNRIKITQLKNSKLIKSIHQYYLQQFRDNQDQIKKEISVHFKQVQDKIADKNKKFRNILTQQFKLNQVRLLNQIQGMKKEHRQLSQNIQLHLLSCKRHNKMTNQRQNTQSRINQVQNQVQSNKEQSESSIRMLTQQNNKRSQEISRILLKVNKVQQKMDRMDKTDHKCTHQKNKYNQQSYQCCKWCNDKYKQLHMQIERIKIGLQGCKIQATKKQKQITNMGRQIVSINKLKIFKMEQIEQDKQIQVKSQIKQISNLQIKQKELVKNKKIKYMQTSFKQGQYKNKYSDNSENMKLLSLCLGYSLSYVLEKPHYIIILNQSSFIGKLDMRKLLYLMNLNNEKFFNLKSHDLIVFFQISFPKILTQILLSWNFSPFQASIRTFLLTWQAIQKMKNKKFKNLNNFILNDYSLECRFIFLFVSKLNSFNSSNEKMVTY